MLQALRHAPARRKLAFVGGLLALTVAITTDVADRLAWAKLSVALVGGLLCLAAALLDRAGRQRRSPLFLLAAVALVLAVSALYRATRNGAVLALYPPALVLVWITVLRWHRMVEQVQSLHEMRQRAILEGQEQERRRLARELHDETLQGLSVIRMTLAAARGGEQREALQQAVQDAIAGIGDQITALRRTIAELRPAVLDQLGLRAALESLAERAVRANDLAVETDLRLRSPRDQPSRVGRVVEAVIYRVAQEAMNNVIKHSRARWVRIRLLERADAIALEVTDDGEGFDLRTVEAGYGLRGMQERAEIVGGELAVSSRTTPPSGTSVRLVIPVDPRRLHPPAARQAAEVPAASSGAGHGVRSTAVQTDREGTA